MRPRSWRAAVCLVPALVLLVAVRCPVRSDAVNIAAGLSALGRVRIPGHVVPLP